MLGLITWVIFGFFVGVIAKWIMPGRDPGGIIVTTLIGIAGAVLGGYIGQAIGLYGANDPVGFIMAIGGAVLLLIIYRLFRRLGGRFRMSIRIGRQPRERTCDISI